MFPHAGDQHDFAFAIELLPSQPAVRDLPPLIDQML
jgi:hypothetical protein